MYSGLGPNTFCLTKDLKTMINTWWNTIREKFPTILFKVILYLRLSLLMSLILFALALGLAVLVSQALLTLLLMIGCVPVLVMYSVIYGPRSFGEKMHHDLLQKWENQSWKIFERSEEKMATLLASLKQKVSFMDYLK